MPSSHPSSLSASPHEPGADSIPAQIHTWCIFLLLSQALSKPMEAVGTEVRRCRFLWDRQPSTNKERKPGVDDRSRFPWEPLKGLISSVCLRGPSRTACHLLIQQPHTGFPSFHLSSLMPASGEHVPDNLPSNPCLQLCVHENPH